MSEDAKKEHEGKKKELKDKNSDWPNRAYVVNDGSSPGHQATEIEQLRAANLHTNGHSFTPTADDARRQSE
jgi:hypothetical protein